MLGQLLDALGQDGDLNLGVAGVDRGVTELGISSALRSLETVIVSPFVSCRPRATLFASDWEAVGGASIQGRGTNRSVCYHKQTAHAHHHRPNMNSIARRRWSVCVAAHTCESPSKNAAVCGSIRSTMSASKVMDMRRAATRLTGRNQLGTRNARRARTAHEPARLGRKVRQHGSPHSTQPKNRSIAHVRQKFKDKGRHEQVHMCRVEPQPTSVSARCVMAR